MMALSTEDVLEIQGLVARYNFAVDGGDADGLARIFHPDAEFSIGDKTWQGLDALRALLTPGDDVGGRRHVASSILVDGDGDQASLRAYVQVFARGDDGAFAVVMVGTYDDDLVRTAEGWRFSARRFRFDP